VLRVGQVTVSCCRVCEGHDKTMGVALVHALGRAILAARERLQTRNEAL
jgi:hypothetical protein